MENKSEDIELINGFLKGDKECFNRLVRKYQKKVYYLALRVMCDHYVAEEVAQEVFMKVYRSLRSLKSKKFFFTWLYKVTFNVCMTTKAKSRNTIDLDSISNIDIKTSKTALDTLEKSELTIRVREAMNRLPKQQRAIFVLRTYENMKFNEIADITGLSLGGVKSNYYYGLIKIKEEAKDLL
jgi:RNA polymerase sigma-70 factor (ECF subfamily)